jgi:manganese/zinc/iron transport system permease protein
MDWPSWSEIFAVVTLQQYNTRLVVASTAVLGLAAGLIGSFLLLRKRSLMGDALSHACLPGIGMAFIVLVAFGGSGKSLPGLLLGATLTGVAGVALVQAIRATTRIKDDAAMGIVLSVFFGIGVAVLGMVQSMPGASAAGLEYFIYGKTASMVLQDFLLLAAVATVVVLVSVLLLKEFAVLCFDEGFAGSQGWPVQRLDLIMLSLVAAVTVVGLQAVGLILIIALLITPAAAARFWTHDLRRMLALAGVIGAVSGWLGASFSALLPRLPAGAVIVLVAAALFAFSMIFGTARGVLRRLLGQRRLRRRVGSHNLLRAVYEGLESRQRAPGAELRNEPMDFADLLETRSWTLWRLRRVIQRARRRGQVESFDGHRLQLSETGFGEAERITRNHRLWEMYLIAHADVAPNHVDHYADDVEHVLGPDMVRKLEDEMTRRGHLLEVPPSPHPVNPGAA